MAGFPLVTYLVKFASVAPFFVKNSFTRIYQRGNVIARKLFGEQVLTCHNFCENFVFHADVASSSQGVHVLTSFSRGIHC